MNTLGDRLRHAMTARGIQKQMALAAEVGVDDSAVSRWQHGSRLSMNHAARVCEVLDISLDWLVLGRGAMDGHKTGVESSRSTRLVEAVADLPDSIFDAMLVMVKAVQAELGSDRR